MAVIKCKMCGGDLDIVEGSTVAECEYCGSKQTIPNQDNEKKLTLFARADRLRRACEFDKAAGVYESIVADFPEEAEAYWGLVLCRYGIEYVDDPATGKKIPTCHRSSFDSILDDTDFDQACENADAISRRLYRDEAKTIENIRRGILEVSGKEEPYDIFICYKETDENGGRTIDSVIAQDVYDALTEKGYRVFFSRISLEDKLGTEYEPYIFAALNSAKIMLVFGTDFEYFNAVWVKNEWSRFLALMAAGQKKTLIPCYKGLDAYDMPKEFQRLQSQDMGKIGAIQDLLRGVEKVFPSQQQEDLTQTKQRLADVGALMRRGRLHLEDKNWSDADSTFDQILNLIPEYSDAYIGKLCVELHVSSENEIVSACSLSVDTIPLDCRPNFIKALRFANQTTKDRLISYNKSVYSNICEMAQSKIDQINIDIDRLEQAIKVSTTTELPQHEITLKNINDEISKLQPQYDSKTEQLATINQEIDRLNTPVGCMWTIIAIIGGYVITLPVWFIGMAIVQNSSGNGAGIYILIMLLTWILSGRWIYLRPTAHLKRVKSEADNINSEIVGIGLELKKRREERGNMERSIKQIQDSQIVLKSKISSYQQEKRHYLQMLEEYQKK
jgi:tetratricopeptide (TPR) repeat protein